MPTLCRRTSSLFSLFFSNGYVALHGFDATSVLDSQSYMNKTCANAFHYYFHSLAGQNLRNQNMARPLEEIEPSHVSIIG